MTPSTFVSTMLTRSSSSLSSRGPYLYALVPALLILTHTASMQKNQLVSRVYQFPQVHLHHHRQGVMCKDVRHALTATYITCIGTQDPQTHRWGCATLHLCGMSVDGKQHDVLAAIHIKVACNQLYLHSLCNTYQKSILPSSLRAYSANARTCSARLTLQAMP